MYLQTDVSPQYLWFDYGTGWVGIGPTAAGGTVVADGSITTVKLADGAVATVKILDGNVTLAKLAANSVDASKIVDGAVGSAEIAGQAVGTAQIADLAVTSAKLATGSIDGSKIIAGTVGATQITDGGVGTAEIAGLAVDSSKIAASAVGATQLADGAVTGAKVNSALKPSGGAADATEALRALGTGAGTAAAGNDPRFSGSIIASGSSLPSSPSNGQMYAFRATGAGGTDGYWMMMWDSGLGLWKCVGGTPWIAARDDLDTSSSTAWINSPADLAFTAPFSGSYRVIIGALLGNAATGGRARIGLSIAGAAPRESTVPFHYAELQTDAGVQASVSKHIALSGVNLGQVLRFQMRCTVAASNIFGNKFLSVIAAST